MCIPKVRSCCFCFPLEQASTIIAWFEIVSGMLLVFSDIVEIINDYYPVFDDVHTLIGGIVTLVCGMILMKGVKGRIVKNVHLWVMISTVVLVVNAIFLVIHFILLVENGRVADAPSTLNVEVFVVTIHAYAIFVVFNYKREIESDDHPPSLDVKELNADLINV